MSNDNDFLNLDSPDNIGVFDELPLWSAPFGLKLLEQMVLKKNITALDIGFGAGFPLTELAMRLGKSCTVYGIDPWEAAIFRTEEKITHYGITNVKIIRGNAENIPLNDGSVDLIVSNNGINNVSDVGKVLAECSRIMKMNGQFVLSVNLNTTMIEFYTAMQEVLTDMHLSDEISKMNEHIFSKRRPLDELISLLKEYGFTAGNIVKDQFAYQFTDGTTLLQHFFIRLAFLPSWKEIVPVHLQKEVFGKIESKLNEKADLSGHCMLTVPFVVINCRKTASTTAHA